MGLKDGDVGSEMVQVAFIVFDGRASSPRDWPAWPAIWRKSHLRSSSRNGRRPLDSDVVLAASKRRAKSRAYLVLRRIAPVGGFEQRPGLVRIIVVQILEAQDVDHRASFESVGLGQHDGRGRLIMLVI